MRCLYIFLKPVFITFVSLLIDVKELLYIINLFSEQAYLILLCFALLHLTVIAYFLQIEGLWQLCVKQVYQRHFLAAFAHFVSLW